MFQGEIEVSLKCKKADYQYNSKTLFTYSLVAPCIYYKLIYIDIDIENGNIFFRKELLRKHLDTFYNYVIPLSHATSTMSVTEKIARS